ncbi:hypothetical protein [Cyclobacterium sp.]|uniref:hypothetical protein n=1 Tax=Cyclobacterium sp. TaxID=1966343 RepID=UPI0019CDC155|nr:hypothetical protein [Cyclobacterium sp.]MBD3627916.1 hypothetical protein [Cyclobacterium sp.]
MNYENRLFAIEQINLLEQKFPVDIWEINGIHVWPLFKKQIYFLLHEDKFSSINNNKNRSKYKKIKSIGNKILSFLIAKKMQFNLKIDKTPIVFSGASSHKVLYENEFINRYFKPINNYLSENNISFLNLSYSTSSQSKGGEIPIDVLLSLFKHEDIQISKIENLPHFSEFTEAVVNLFKFDKELFLTTLFNNLKTVSRWKKLYIFIFKKTKPKASFGLCYYSSAMFGMNLAANELGIKSIDMQHGAQGKLHPAYHYAKISSKGYNSLPNEFWCWDESSRLLNLEWTRGTRHQVKLSGNPWLYYVNKIGKNPYIPKKKPIILFTHQPINPPIDPYLVDAIKATCDDFLWMIRLHPRISSQDKSEMVTILKAERILDKIDFKFANDLALPFILKHAAIHISKFSGAIIEGVSLDVPTIILEEIGISTFANLLKPGRVIGIEFPSKDIILNTITQITDKNQKRMNEFPDFIHLIDELVS